MVKLGKSNISITKICAVHCYNCGECFQNNSQNLKETEHHAIPQKMKPKRNFLIPICHGCHTKLNEHFMPKEQMARFKRRLGSLKLQADSIIKMVNEDG